jgi:hypothetical protein
MFDAATEGERREIVKELTRRKSRSARSTLAKFGRLQSAPKNSDRNVEFRKIGRNFRPFPIEAFGRTRQLREAHNLLVAKYDAARLRYIQECSSLMEQLQLPEELPQGIRTFLTSQMLMRLKAEGLSQPLVLIGGITAQPKESALSEIRRQGLESLWNAIKRYEKEVAELATEISTNLTRLRQAENPKSEAVQNPTGVFFPSSAEPPRNRLPPNGGQWSNCRRCGGTGGLSGGCSACGGNGFEQAFPETLPS